MVWPRLTNSKLLIPLLQHLPNKEIAGVPVSDQFDYTYNSEFDAPSLHVLLIESTNADIIMCTYTL